MKLICFALFISFCISYVLGQTCSPNYIGQISPNCTFGNPYCQLTSQSGGNFVYSCVACVSECDCGLDQYCSGAPGSVGTCVTFSQAGSSCLPMSSFQLADPTIPSSWKCAATYTQNGNFFVDFKGVCINEECRICNFRTSNGCIPGQGTQTERTCVYPGNYYETHSAAWVEGAYYEYPPNVWWAIIFVFVILILGVQVTHLVFVIKSTL